jgi:hypothetical protein
LPDAGERDVFPAWLAGRLPAVAIAGAALYLLVALTNPGIVAVDDFRLMERFLPAQRASPSEVIEGIGIRSPLVPLLHIGITRAALAVGIEHPLAQLHADMVVVGLVSFAAMLWAALASFEAYDAAPRERHRVVAAALLGFYFIAALFFTRPMVEAVAAPFLALSAGLACRYWARGTPSALVLAVAALALAAMIRPQAGVCAIVLVLLAAWRRRPRDLVVLAATGLVAIVLTGLPDLVLRGRFHESLRLYVAFNVAKSSNFGVGPWYVYTLLLIALTLPPVFVSRYRGFPWRERYRPLLPTLLYFAVFVAAHSAVPHKEERFMIPAAPLFLVLLTPLTTWLAERPEGRWRIQLLLAVNTTLLVLAISHPIQASTIGLARFLDAHPEYRAVATVKPGPIRVASMLVRQPLEVASVPLAADAPLDCGTLVVAFAASAGARELAADPRRASVGRFEPGPLERLVVAINPRRNARRGALEGFAERDCGVADGR